ncbi:MAG: aminotransferase class IV [Bacteroidetes bacterium]|nr:aminotransferase class IV [Bacteroidota bacterium]MCY4225396.1 aminotransferase class IV [Bacteroidota bacterium]
MHTSLSDQRNETINVWVKDQLLPRSEAKVSVFDSVVQGGDAVWEGIRVYDGKIFQLDVHLSRLMDSAHAMGFTDLPSKEFITNALFETLKSNGMRDHTHVRLTLTRGEKITSGMDPRLNVFGPTLIILAEWKKPVFADNGIRLITSTVRRNPPQCLDSKIHHNNLINNILAKIQANLAGVDEAVMLDLHGYLSETNATNLFLVKNSCLYTPHADSCLPGVTRAMILDIATDLNIPAIQRNLSTTEMYTSCEMFTTGTMGELDPVVEVDGRIIGNGKPGPMTLQLCDEYWKRTRSQGVPLPF